MNLEKEHPLAIAVVEAIHKGDLEKLGTLLKANPGLASAKLGDPCEGKKMSRTLLHVATDWPGNFPNVAGTISLLVAAGADVNARFTGPHTETPLHWAASSDDVAALDALLDHGADIEAPGAVIGSGTPLSDAVAFGQWKAAKRLVEREARTPLAEAAAMGLTDRLKELFLHQPPPTAKEVNRAFWYACHGGQRPAAEFLLQRGADMNWLPHWERKTPLDAARRSQAAEIVEWLKGLGATSADGTA